MADEHHHITIVRPIRQVVVSRPGPQGPPGPAWVVGAVVSSILMACSDGTNHLVELVTRSGRYTVRVDQEHTPGTAVALIPFRAADQTVHEVTCVVRSGKYTLHVNQDPV